VGGDGGGGREFHDAGGGDVGISMRVRRERQRERFDRGEGSRSML
jgi:hypothetical protein